MAELEFSEQRIKELRERWETVSEKLRRLYKEKDLENRADRLFQLEEAIKITEAERTDIAAVLKQYEREYEKTRLIREVRRFERNKAFREAIQAWEEIRKLDPDNPQSAIEIERLTQCQQQAQRVVEYRKLLTRRMQEIEPIYTKVIEWLQQAPDDEVLLDVINSFLQQELSAERFITAWHANTMTPPRVNDVNYAALIDRLKRGDIVLFLGSDTTNIFDSDVLKPEVVIKNLAVRAGYHDFIGSLSMIAEYYHMKPEYGRSSLIYNLYNIIGNILPNIDLYKLLAHIEQPLVLVSTSYDTWLEMTFRQAKKKYVVIAPIIRSTMMYDIGYLHIHYSDREMPEKPCLEEALSGLEPFEHGYSLIYKVRGCCDAISTQNGQQQDSLTLSETDYFAFARHVDKLIPDYLVTMFSGRGLFFLGYAPTHWEDRLLVNSILKRRHPQAEKPVTIDRNTDQFRQAYWDFQNVSHWSIELTTFVTQLAAHT